MQWFAQGLFGIGHFRFWWSAEVQLIWFVLIVYAIAAGWTDFHSRTIPNWLSGLAFVVIMGIRFITGATMPALVGFVLTGVLYLLPTIFRVWGRGDWKMSMIYGTVLGLFPTVILWSVSILLAKVGSRRVISWSRNYMESDKAISIPLVFFVLCGTIVAYATASAWTVFHDSC